MKEKQAGEKKINVVLIYLDEIMQMKTFTKRKLDDQMLTHLNAREKVKISQLVHNYCWENYKNK